MSKINEILSQYATYQTLFITMGLSSKQRKFVQCQWPGWQLRQIQVPFSFSIEFLSSSTCQAMVSPLITSKITDSVYWFAAQGGRWRTRLWLLQSLWIPITSLRMGNWRALTSSEDWGDITWILKRTREVTGVCCMYCAACTVLHALCCMPCAACTVLHALCCMPCAVAWIWPIHAAYLNQC